MGNMLRFIPRARITSKALGSPTNRRRRHWPAAIERLEDRRLLSTISFDGLAIRGGDPEDVAKPLSVPPDTMGTVSPSYIVQLINGEYRWQSRSGGAATVHSDTLFWELAGISNIQNLGDPRILYDPLTSRFIATELEWDNAKQVYKVLIATSAGGDPTDNVGNWKATSLSVSTGSDFPTLGVDNAGVYIAVNILQPNYVSSSIYALPLSDIFWATGNSPTTANAIPFLNLLPGGNGGTPSTFQPAVDFTAGKPSSSPEFITDRIELITGSDFTGIETRKLTWTGVHSATLSSPTTASFGTYYALPTGAAQPGTPSGLPYLDAGGGWLTNTLVVSGSIWTIAPSAIQGNDGAVVAQISNSNLGTIAQQQVLWAPGDSFLYPSLAVNSSGTIAVGATGVSSNTYPSAFVFGRLASDPQGSWAPTQAAEQGIANYDENSRWGDYSVTLLDPSNSSVFWTLQEDVEYPDTGPGCDNWTTVWRAFSINAGGASATNLAPAQLAAPTVISPALSTASASSPLEASPDVLDALRESGSDMG